MLEWIAVALRSRRNQILRSIFTSYIQGMERPHRANFEGFYTVLTIVGWTGWAGEVEYVVNFAAVEGFADVGFQKFEAVVIA